MYALLKSDEEKTKIQVTLLRKAGVVALEELITREQREFWRGNRKDGALLKRKKNRFAKRQRGRSDVMHYQTGKEYWREKWDAGDTASQRGMPTRKRSTELRFSIWIHFQRVRQRKLKMKHRLLCFVKRECQWGKTVPTFKTEYERITKACWIVK